MNRKVKPNNGSYKEGIIAILSHIRRSLKDPSLAAVIVLSIIFSIIFSIFSILKMYSLSASGWDLGLESQIMNNTLHGQFFYSNLLGFSLLQEHFSPFVFAILGAYSIYPSPITLLILQAIFVSFAAVPLYLFGARFAGFATVRRSGIVSALLILVVGAYLLSPFTQGLIFFDFHIMSFLPFFFFLSFYAFISGKKSLHLLSLMFIVSLHSNFVFIVATIVVTEFLVSRMYLRNRVPNNKLEAGKMPLFNSKSRRSILTAFVLSFFILFLYLILAGYLKSLISGTAAVDLSLHTGEVGGYSSVTGLIYGLLTNPLSVFQLLVGDYSSKLVTIYYGFGSSGFLSFFSPIILLTSIPYFFYAFFSTNTAYYALGYQYPAMVLPAIFISAVISVSEMPEFVRKFSKTKYKELSWKVTATSLLILLIGGMIISTSVDPVTPSPLYKPVDAFSTYHVPNVGEATDVILYLSSHLNKSDYILTQNNLFPFFSVFPHAYSTPWSPGVNNSTVSNFNYIIGDYASTWVMSSNGQEPSIYSIIAKDLQDHSYGIYVEAGPILAIKKGYIQKPVLYDLFNGNFTPKSLHIDNGYVLPNGTLEAHNVSNAFVWNGPYITLFPGIYNISYSVGFSNFSNNSFLQLQTTAFSGNTVMYKHNVTGNSTIGSGVYYLNINTTLNIIYPVLSVEFRGYGNFTGTVFLKGVQIHQSSIDNQA